MKRTPWFTWPETPARAGIYEFRYTNYGGIPCSVRRWEWRKNGKWMQWVDEEGRGMASMPGDEWRGLTKEAK